MHKEALSGRIGRLHRRESLRDFTGGAQEMCEAALPPAHLDGIVGGVGVGDEQGIETCMRVYNLSRRNGLVEYIPKALMYKGYALVKTGKPHQGEEMLQKAYELATRNGLVKKTRLADYDSTRSGGLIAINLREGDEVVGAALASAEDDVLLVSRGGQSVRFTATDEALRPMGRATSGVIGMHFRDGDELLSASVADGEGFVFVVTEGGFAKRTELSQYRVQNRGGIGIKVARLQDARGDLVGALLVDEDDEVLVVLASGKVVRSAVAEVPAKGRDTMGVVFARFDDDDRIIAIARNSERNVDADPAVVPAGDAVAADPAGSSVGKDEDQ